MNPSTGTFISMDSYQGSVYDPVTLHKYLYANANPVIYTDPSGYMALPALTASMSISQIISASWKYIGLTTLTSTLTGAVFGAVDSILGGNEFSQVIQDSLKGAKAGAIFGCLLSALTCFSVICPYLVIGLQTLRGIIVASGVVGVYVSAKEERPAQAIFRAIVGVMAFVGMGKHIEGVKVQYLGDGVGKGVSIGVVNGKTPASRFADKIQNLPNKNRPNTVAVVRTADGKYYAGYNKGGVINLKVQNILDSLGNTNSFNRQCAEVNAISRAVNAGANLDGSTISIANVRGPNSASGVHGTYKAPCDVCEPLIGYFNIKDIN